MKKLILIDSNALVHRAFHALPPSLSSKGIMTNAVFGFTSVLIKMIKDLKPDYMAATFDLAGPTFRHEEFAEYKIHREKAPDELYSQIPIVKKILACFGVPIFEKEGFEADDLIGTLSKRGSKYKDVQVVIVTGDLDTLQLVEGDKVVVFTLRKGVTDTVTYNEKAVLGRYNLKPEQLVDYRGLKGDPSDNIPGVPGIGEKTASALIKEFGTLDNLYEAVENYKPIKKTKSILTEKLVDKLREFKDQAFFSKKLSMINCEIDVNFDLKIGDWRGNFDMTGLENVLKEYGLFSLLKRLPEIEMAGSTSEQPSQLNFEIEEGKPTIVRFENDKEIGRFLEQLKKTDFFCFDLADNDLNIFYSDKVYCFPANVALNGDLKAEFASVFENEEIGKACHDLKSAFRFFVKNGVHLQGVVFDTKIAAHLINSQIKDFAFEKIYFLHMNRSPNPNISLRPFEIHELYEDMAPEIETLGLKKVFNDIELPLSGVLAEMELNGIKIDLGAIKKLSGNLTKEIQQIEKEIFSLAGTEFNINSPQQLSKVIFEVLNLKGKVRKTGKGKQSTAAAELEKLTSEHPVIEKIMQYRELQKLKTTYIDPFPNFVDKDTGRLYTTLNQTGTVTGRLSSQEPNLQNIPIRTEMGQEFRKAFIADTGFCLLSLDYSQLELRVVAHIAEDEKMIEAFKRGEDIHNRTAAEIFGVAPDKVTSGMRREAKVLNFGVLYGMGQMGFQRAAGVGRTEAKNFIQKYMEEFSGVAQYIEDTKIKARDTGFVSTIFGRRRQIPEIYSSIPELIRQAERMAVNMPVQGTAADLIKMAMIKISELLHEKYSDKEIKLLLQIHDELLFEVKEGKLEKVTKEIREIMENIYELKVPLIVDAKYGKNWSEMEKI